MPENTNKVIQLKDTEGNDVSPVVNVGSIYDKNGQKVDNLLSYTVAGTDVTVPELEDVKTQIQNELNGTMDAATLGGSTKEEIIASVPAPDLSNVNAAKLNGYTKNQIVSEAKTNVNATQLGGHPASYFAPATSIPDLLGISVKLLANTTYTCDGVQRVFMPSAQIPENAFYILYCMDISKANSIGSTLGRLTYMVGSGSDQVLGIPIGENNIPSKISVSFLCTGTKYISSGPRYDREWVVVGAHTNPETWVEENSIPRGIVSDNITGTVGIKVYAFCLG